MAAVNLALAMKQNPKQASYHFQLGLVLEEHYYAQDMFGYKTEVGTTRNEPPPPHSRVPPSPKQDFHI